MITTLKAEHEDQSSFIPQDANKLVNSLTGLLSKAADTAIDLYALKETKKAVGTTYPTGQKDPAQVVVSQNDDEKLKAQTVAQPINIGGLSVDPKILMLGGAVAFGSLVLILILKK